jgi:Ca2+-transporting ATPase
MTTVHKVPDADTLNAAAGHLLKHAVGLGNASYVAVLKGALDSVLEVCSEVWTADGCRSLEPSDLEAISVAGDELAAAGKRVLGIAVRGLETAPDDESAHMVEQDFAFLAMAGLIDPPRKEAQEAVQRCRSAGIRPIMITGDHPLTAQHIAQRVGITNSDHAITGRQLEETSDQDLENIVKDTSVYARVSPEHKLRIVEALQRNGQIVAMTGDGVNDAPALKAADIGVAMGITGTDVSKDASETVLLDDNFATIVNSVEEGRVIYDNIRKFLKYTMTSNTGEIWVMLAAPFLGMPLPLVPLQILWVNLVTDGLPGLAMAVEPGERNIMLRPPRDPVEPIFDRDMIHNMLFIGILMGFVSLGIGYHYWSANPTEFYDASWGTFVFTVLTLSQMGNAMAVRSSRDSLFKIGLFSNPAMIASVGLTLALQLAVIYVPFLQRIFRTTALSLPELLLCIVVSTIVFWAAEGEKWFKRRRESRESK